MKLLIYINDNESRVTTLEERTNIVDDALYGVVGGSHSELAATGGWRAGWVQTGYMVNTNYNGGTQIQFHRAGSSGFASPDIAHSVTSAKDAYTISLRVKPLQYIQSFIFFNIF